MDQKCFVFIAIIVKLCNGAIIQNLQDYCVKDVCRGLNYSSNENVQFGTDIHFIQTHIEFTACKLPTVPWNLFVILPHLRILSMDNCQLEYLQKWNFEFGRNLSELVLSNNQVKLLPNEVFIYLKNLTYLDLERNQIDSLLFDSFHGLSRLEVLYLDDNQLTEVPWDLLKPLKKLKIIGLSDNRITGIDDRFFEGNADLKQVYLGNNRLTILDTYLPEYLKLTPIYMANVNSSTVVTSSRFLFHLKAVEKLDLSMNFIAYISNETFKEMRELRHLNLSTTNLISLHLFSFTRQDKLLTLDISGNNQRYINMELFTPSTSLVNLFLDGNQLLDIDYRKLIRKHPSLKRIGLSYNNWGCSSLLEMIRAFQAKRVEVYSNPHRKNTLRRSNRQNVIGVDCVS